MLSKGATIRIDPAKGCLVADLRMPEMDGLELVDALRARHITFPAILIISERATAQLKNRAGRSGVAQVLEKPLSDSALVESIHHAFGAHP